MSELGGESREIDGHLFDVGYLNTKVARKTWIKLLKSVGPSLATAQDGNLGGAVELLASQSHLESSFEETIATMMKVTTCDGRALVQCEQEVFKGKVGLTLKWLKFALEVNFKDFLDLMGDLLAEAAPAQDSK